MSNDIKRLYLLGFSATKIHPKIKSCLCFNLSLDSDHSLSFSLSFSSLPNLFLFQFLNALIIFNIFFRPFSNLPFNFKPKLDSVPLMLAYNTSPSNKNLRQGVVSEQRYIWPWIGGSVSLSELWDWRPVSHHCHWRSPASSWGLWLVTKAGPWLKGAASGNWLTCSGLPWLLRW